MTFQKGHIINLDRKRSEETKKKLSLSKMGSKNPMFGKKWSREALEQRVKTAKSVGVGRWNLGRIASEETRQKISRALSKNQVIFLCDNCGKETKKCRSHYLRENKHFCSKHCNGVFNMLKGRSLPLKIRLKMKSSASRGMDCHFWKGGITPINEKIRTSFKYRLWREKVYRRDNYTCQLCGIKNGMGVTVYLHSHHILPFSIFPQYRFTVKNGITLCKDCHRLTLKKEWLYAPKFLGI